MLFRRGPRVCTRRITLEQLEERIVLDAAVAAASQDNPENQQDNQGTPGQAATGTPAPAAVPDASPSADGAGQGADGPAAELSQVVQQDLKVVLVPKDLGQIEAIAGAAIEGANVIVYDPETDNLGTISLALSNLAGSTGQKIGAIALISHADSGALSVGSDLITATNLHQYSSNLIFLSGSLSADAQIQLYGCSLAGETWGKEVVQGIALFTGADIFASSDDSGGAAGNWFLEFSSNPQVPMVNVLNVDALSAVDTHLALSDFASEGGIGELIPVGKKLFFWSTDPNYVAPPESEGDLGPLYLWYTDVYASDPKKANLPYTEWNFGPDHVVANDRLYFVASTAEYGQELYYYDPASEAGGIVMDIAQGMDYWGFGPAGSYPANITDVNGILYFSACDQYWDGTDWVSHGSELWMHNPSTGQTQRLTDIADLDFMGGSEGSSDPGPVYELDGKLFFSAWDDDHGTELWMYDLTTGSASLVADIAPGTFHTYYGTDIGFDSNPEILGDMNGMLFFAAHDTDDSDYPNHHYHIWRYDPDSGLPPVMATEPLGVEFFLMESVYFGDTSFFVSAYVDASPAPGSDYRSLWKCDGSNLTEIYYLNDTNSAQAAGDKIFMYNWGGGGPEIWVYDTNNATDPLVQIASGVEVQTGDNFVYEYNGLYLFCGDGELYRTDGTAAGTYILKDINTSGQEFASDSESPKRDHFVGFVYDGLFYFNPDDGVHGRELWQTDGTSDGTRLAEAYPDINPGPAGSSPYLFTVVNPLFFVVTTASGESVYAVGALVPPPPGPPPVVPPAELPSVPAASVPGLAPDVGFNFQVPAAKFHEDGFSGLHQTDESGSTSSHLRLEAGGEGKWLGRFATDAWGRFGKGLVPWVGDILDLMDNFSGSSAWLGGNISAQGGMVGLPGYADVVQDGGSLVFNLDSISITDIFTEHIGLEDTTVKLASVQDFDAEADWMRLVDSCRGKCTGNVGFLELLLQSSPSGVKHMGQNLIGEALAGQI